MHGLRSLVTSQNSHGYPTNLSGSIGRFISTALFHQQLLTNGSMNPVTIITQPRLPRSSRGSSDRVALR